MFLESFTLAVDQPSPAYTVSRLPQWSNMYAMFSTFDVLKLDRSKIRSLDKPIDENMCSILVTFDVSKLDRSSSSGHTSLNM